MCFENTITPIDKLIHTRFSSVNFYFRIFREGSILLAACSRLLPQKLNNLTFLSSSTISSQRFLLEALNNMACEEFFNLAFKVLSGF